MDAARSALAEAARHHGANLKQLSRWLGRNDAYLQQFVTRGSPRKLAETDRRRLAQLLAIPESALGGPDVPPDLLAVPRLDIAVSAGPGRIAETEPARTLRLDPALLRALGVRAAAASLVRVEGDSMAPDLRDGDEVLVDADRRDPARPGVYVVRLDGALMVKRAAPANGGLTLTSDNPEAPSPGWCAADRVAVVGRVVWLMRALG